MRTKILFSVRIVVPVVLLYIILTRIDLTRVLDSLADANLLLWGAALIVGYFSQVVFGVLRWKIELSRFYGIGIPFGRLLRYFWEGMFIGYFAPASSGTDLYRVVRAASEVGHYDKNLAVIVNEKLLIIITDIVLVMVTYPFVQAYMTTDVQVTRAVFWVYLLGFATLSCFLLALLSPRAGKVRQWGQSIVNGFERAFRSMVKRLGRGRLAIPDQGAVVSLIRPLFCWRKVLAVVAVSVLLRLVAGIGGKLMLQAVGVDLPLVVHVFVWTFMMLVFMLPVSFGTLGVREGCYIVLFGLFGVESTTALTASFVGLTCLLVTTSIGGLIFLVKRVKN